MGRRKRTPRLRLRESGHYQCWYIDARGKRQWKKLARDLSVAMRQQAAIEERVALEREGITAGAMQRVLLDDLVAVRLTELGSRVQADHLHASGRDARAVIKLTGATTVADLRIDVVEKARAALLAAGDSRNTVNRKMSALKSMLSWAERSSIITRNPIAAMRELPIAGFETFKRHRLSIKEARAVVAAARYLDANRYHKRARIPQAPIVETLLGTGFRIGEAMRLCWRACSLVSTAPSITVEKRDGKNKRARTVFIQPDLSATLRTMRAEQGRVLGRLPSEDDRVFLTSTGLPLTRDWGTGAGRRWLHRVLKAAGVERLRGNGAKIDFHALRHSHGQFLLDAGVDLATVSSILGHKTVDLTRRIYVDMDRAVGPKMEAARKLPCFEAEAGGGEQARRDA